MEPDESDIYHMYFTLDEIKAIKESLGIADRGIENDQELKQVFDKFLRALQEMEERCES